MTATIINKETGEVCGQVICVKCNPNINKETGEWESNDGIVKQVFKIPSTYEEKRVTKVEKEDVTVCTRRSQRKYFVLLAVLTLCMVLPAVGATIWVLIETVLHLYTHRYPNRFRRIRHALHRLVFAEFCAICQSERRMDLIGKLQDVRTNKMRQYVRNIPIGS